MALSSNLKSARVRKSVDVRGKEMRVVGVVMVGIRRSDAPLTSTDFVIKVSSLKP
jgi:hypothetical protein